MWYGFSYSTALNHRPLFFYILPVTKATGGKEKNKKEKKKQNKTPRPYQNLQVLINV